MPNGFYENHAGYGSRLLPFIVNDIVCEHQDFSPHWHEGTELLLCTSGEGRVIIDGVSFDFTPGRILLVNKNQLHDVMNESIITYSYIIIFDDFLKENGFNTNNYAFDSLIVDDDIRALFLKMHRSFKSKEAPLRIRLDAMELLYALAERFCTEISSSGENSSTGIRAAIEYIRRNYTEDISLQGIARIASLSKYYFAKRFKAITGRTYSDFLGYIRCQRATVLLKVGVPVSEVCFSVGYNDPAYFSRVFKKYNGISPSKYIHR